MRDMDFWSALRGKYENYVSHLPWNTCKEESCSQGEHPLFLDHLHQMIPIISLWSLHHYMGNGTHIWGCMPKLQSSNFRCVEKSFGRPITLYLWVVKLYISYLIMQINYRVAIITLQLNHRSIYYFLLFYLNWSLKGELILHTKN